MSHRSPISKVSALLLLVFSFYILSACTSAPTPDPLSSGTADDGAGTNDFSTISVGSEGRLVDVVVDDEITTWLNTIAESDNELPPTPKNDAWQTYTMPTGDTVIFEARGQASFDVLEILAYPDGLDAEGVPVSVVTYPLCGPHAEISCEDAAWGTSGVKISSGVVEEAIADTEYYAIGGILLPNGDSHPDSFMALLRKQSGDEEPKK